MDTPLFPSAEMFSAMKVHLQAIGVDIDRDYETATPETAHILRQWWVGKSIHQLRVLAGLISTNPMAYGITMQSPSGTPLITCIFRPDYDTELWLHHVEKIGTGWQIPQANSVMDALLLLHQMRLVGGAYVREHILPNLGPQWPGGGL